MANNCGSCGTPMRKDRNGDISCPKCYSEDFVGFGPETQKTETRHFPKGRQMDNSVPAEDSEENLDQI